MYAIRRATGEDAETLSLVAQQTFIEGWGEIVGHELALAYVAESLNPVRLRAEIADPALLFLLAVNQAERTILGYIKLDFARSAHESIGGEEAVCLQRLYVAAAARGRGVADALLAAGEAEVRTRGAQLLWLECDPRNARAWRFYEKRHFVEVGTTVYYLPDGANDNVRIMAKRISRREERNVSPMSSLTSYQPKEGAVALANPLQGTDSVNSFSTGNTLPITAMPHGMTHWSLQSNGNLDRWFFHPREHTLTGIRATHQPSPWMGDYGQFVLMPQSGLVKPSAGGRSSAYRAIHHRPDYVAVELLRDGWVMEFAPTERGGILQAHRAYTTTAAPIRLLLERYDTAPEALVWDTERNRVSGFTRVNRGGVTENFAHYFVLEFAEPVQDVSEQGGVSVIEFAPGTGFTARIGTSFISLEQAERNLATEIGSASVAEIADRAGTRWNELLERITLAGAPQDQARTFYSCLYRGLLFPRKLHEPDGSGNWHHYSPYTGKIEAGVLYTDNGFWDTFRTVYSLLSIAYPDLLGEIIDGWLEVYRQSGFLPEWASPGHRGCMIGTHSQVVIADAVIKGIQGFDYQTALDAVIAGATTPVPDGSPFAREGGDAYDELGYIPFERINKATSRTTDYAYDDYCVAQIARVVGKQDLYERFMKQSERWRNVFDTETKFFRGRSRTGEWQTPFDPFEWGGAFVEGSAWQFRFSVPHDPAGLAELFGGAQEMAAAIAEMETAPSIYGIGSYGQTIHEMTEMAAASFGQYAHSNQPVHETLHMAAAVGFPEVTNRIVRRVLTEYYTPDSFPGDEDNGEMASWYVLAALGIFPLCPGKDEYILNAPLFPEATIAVPGGKTIRIVSDDTPQTEATYRWRTTWNGETVTTPGIAHSALVQGGELRFAP